MDWPRSRAPSARRRSRWSPPIRPPPHRRATPAHGPRRGSDLPSIAAIRALRLQRHRGKQGDAQAIRAIDAGPLRGHPGTVREAGGRRCLRVFEEHGDVIGWRAGSEPLRAVAAHQQLDRMLADYKRIIRSRANSASRWRSRSRSGRGRGPLHLGRPEEALPHTPGDRDVPAAAGRATSRLTTRSCCSPASSAAREVAAAGGRSPPDRGQAEPRRRVDRTRPDGGQRASLDAVDRYCAGRPTPSSASLIAKGRELALQPQDDGVGRASPPCGRAGARTPPRTSKRRSPRPTRRPSSPRIAPAPARRRPLCGELTAGGARRLSASAASPPRGRSWSGERPRSASRETWMRQDRGKMGKRSRRFTREMSETAGSIR